MKGLLKKYFFLPLFLLLSGGPHMASGQVSKKAFLDYPVRAHHAVANEALAIERATATHSRSAVSQSLTRNTCVSCVELIEESVNNTLKFSSAAVVSGYVRHCFRFSEALLPSRKLFAAGDLIPVKSLYLVFRVFRL